MDRDKQFMLRAIVLARESIKNGGGPFGAVITKGDEILSEAYNRVVLSSDPTAHAEILAIREASGKLKSFDLDGCTLYASCEPCPMCLGAIYWAGIKKVVYACDRNDAAQAGFSDKLIYDELMHDPKERKITFVKSEESEGKAVFTEWNRYDKKIPY